MIEVTIGTTSYKIPCKESQKEKVLNLAKNLDKKVRNLAIQLRSTDEAMLLVMAGLMLEEEIEQKNELIENNPANEEELFNALSDNMENVANYIEKLTKKIRDS